MIKKFWRRAAAGFLLALVCPLLPSCQPRPGKESPELQGVVELEEVPLGFELPGRLTEVRVRAGDVVEASAVLARLDDTLERSARAAQAEQVEVARQQAGAARAGPRGEELGSLRARVDAAKATEQLLEKHAARERVLVEKGALAKASLDDAEARLATARAERRSLEHAFRLLRDGARKEDVSVADARVRAAAAPAQLVSQALPLTHFLRIVRGITLKGATFADVAQELAWLGGIFTLLVALTSLRFSKKLV